ncbi:MAG TPA: hypothetical protein VGK87_05000 [Anaerolineae bacterium]
MAAVVLATLPIIHILSIVCTTGADVLSSDLIYHVAALSRIFSPSYPLQNILRDSYYNGHLMFFPMLLRIVLAKLAYWNAYIELLFGLGASILTLCLICSAIGARSRSIWMLWLLPILSVMIFSTNQINQFTFGDAAVPMGFCSLGIVFAMWSLVRYRCTWTAVGLAIGGAWFATWSWGQGIVVWPLLLGAIVASNLYGGSLFGHASSRRQNFTFAQMATVVVAGVVSVAPVLALLLTTPASVAQRIVNPFNLDFILSGIGAAFVNGANGDISTQIACGTAGLMGAGACIALVWISRCSKWLHAIAPGCYLMAASIVSLWVLGLFRHGISIWYTGIGMLFWLGLTGAAFVILSIKRTSAEGAVLLALRLLCGLGAGGALVASIVTGMTMNDKVYFLYARSPASAACVRSAEAAPAYCEQRVILEGTEGSAPEYVLASQLKALGLSVFAPNQHWALQGDYGLDAVSVSDPPGVAPLQWLDDQTLQPLPWYDYRHLDLRLPVSNTVSWTMYLPRTAQRATFQSAIMATDATAQINLQTDVTAMTPLFSQRLSSTQSGWHPVDIDLLPYKGQTVTLVFASAPGSASSVLYRYPMIDVLLDSDPAMAAESQRVVNVKPAWGENDAVFAARAGQMEYTLPVSACLGNFTHLSVRMSLAQEALPRVAQWTLLQADTGATGAAPRIQLPLLGDSDLHTYTFPLKLIDLRQTARLAGLRLELGNPAETVISKVVIEDVRFVGFRAGDYCR